MVEIRMVMNVILNACASIYNISFPLEFDFKSHVCMNRPIQKVNASMWLKGLNLGSINLNLSEFESH